MPRPFLTARWEGVLLANCVCPPERLEPLVPAGCRLDLWRGEALVSVVGFLFRDTRLLGVPVPFHRHFEEVNLRFYVTHETPGGEVRRGVTFVRELVPRRAIATVARVVYNEPYRAVPMDHAVALDPATGGAVDYGWRWQGGVYALRGGYTRQRDGGTVEYHVEHPSWDLWTLDEVAFDGDGGALYGPAFADVLAAPPRSAFLAVGSAVAVHRGRRIELA